MDTLKKQVTFFQNRLRPAGGVVGRFHHHRSSTTDALLQKLLHHAPVSPSRHHMSLIDGEDDEDDEEDDFSVDLGFDCVEQHNDNASSAIVNKTSAPTSPSPSSDPHPPSKDLSSVVPSGSASNR